MNDKNDAIRNLAIIAHVDHGKTTLVDALLKQGKVFQPHQQVGSLIMDTNPLERERGITILAKNASVSYGGVRINLIDTPGHADFSGEVERVMNMADGCLLLVDAVDGPMPQTTYVLRQALQQDVTPMVVINKIDRPEARVAEVEGLVQDLFLELATRDDHLDFPVLYTSAKQGYASRDSEAPGADMKPLFESILSSVPPPAGDPDAPLQMLVAALDYDTYVGQVCVGRISSGALRPRDTVTVLGPGGAATDHTIEFVFVFHGMERVEVAEAYAGDIVAVTGPEGVSIGDTIASRESPQALPTIAINEPTVRMTFGVNTSPFASRDGRFVTGRHLRERLRRELIHNVALRVEESGNPDRFQVSGRGELHLAILIENMRREGHELAVACPEVIHKTVDGRECEPFEHLSVDVEEAHRGTVMEMLGSRRGTLDDVQPGGPGRTRLDYVIPARALIGLRTEFLSATSGSGLMHHTFSHYAPRLGEEMPRRRGGALIANAPGKALAYALFNLQERGRLLIGPGEEVYEGMVVGIHSRANDLVVNPMKAKQLTNIRAAGSDENILLTPPLSLTLETAMALIERDELVEITPNAIRIRKAQLHEHERRRRARAGTKNRRASA